MEAVRKAVDAGKGKPGDGNGAGPVLIDVREKDEWSEGFIPGARWISRGFLEQRIEDQVPERSSEVVLYCAGGTRSAYAAKTLAEMGYTNVKSMAGGFSAWKRAGLKFDRPFVMTPDQSLRYARHTMMKEICAQCLQRHVDPVTGKETIIFSCSNQDQLQDHVDWKNLADRLRQNTVQEKLTDRWVQRLLARNA